MSFCGSDITKGSVSKKASFSVQDRIRKNVINDRIDVVVSRVTWLISCGSTDSRSHFERLTVRHMRTMLKQVCPVYVVFVICVYV